jgi:hypothetical protein
LILEIKIPSYQWRALVTMAVNLRFHKMLGSSSVAAQLVASQEGLSSMSE